MLPLAENRTGSFGMFFINRKIIVTFLFQVWVINQLGLKVPRMSQLIVHLKMKTLHETRIHMLHYILDYIHYEIMSLIYWDIF